MVADEGAGAVAEVPVSLVLTRRLLVGAGGDCDALPWLSGGHFLSKTFSGMVPIYLIEL